MKVVMKPVEPITVSRQQEAATPIGFKGSGPEPSKGIAAENIIDCQSEKTPESRCRYSYARLVLMIE